MMIRSRLVLASLATAVSFAVATPACFAQATKKQAELEIPKAQTISLDTKDYVTITCTYYPGGYVETGEDDKKKVEKKPGKEVVPVILLHGWEGRRTDYDALASSLQALGHAVIVPDLRGHGGSMTRKLPNGASQDIDRDRMRSTDLQGMLLDVEATKKFLFDKNNEGELNIELLCIVGADLGAIVAVNWAALDWSRQQLPAFKQGRDVKALVLLSPEQSFKGYTLNQALQHAVVRTMSTMIVVGNDDRKASSNAKAIHSRIERFHETPPDDPAEKIQKQDLFFVPFPTTLQGTHLVRVRGVPATRSIAQFIELRLVRKSDQFPWTDRKNPLAE